MFYSCTIVKTYQVCLEVLQNCSRICVSNHRLGSANDASLFLLQFLTFRSTFQNKSFSELKSLLSLLVHIIIVGSDLNTISVIVGSSYFSDVDF